MAVAAELAEHGRGRIILRFKMQPKVKLTVIGKKFPDELIKALKTLTLKEVLAGVPEAKAPRKRGTATNALLAYVHDNGSPLQNIPPRPFLCAGIEEGKEEITKYLEQAGKAALHGDAMLMDKALNAVGLAAQKAIRKKIQTGPFTPLKASTVAARKRKRKSRNNTQMTPLIDTGQLLQSINYVINDK